ncbi:unnamed protein product [Microthlaspi erraticum]|uniref:Uncharacterized protein n=1 Tax=Microthlaspi erraticum TaxID=1685480 RepID=A0A6D2J554_9BRAS|nr:unnamed protein product [Microthlaspi erraticum]
MTNKRNSLQDQPTAASSSDDDEMETSGAESEEASSSSNEETKDPAAKPPSSAVTIAVPGKPTVSAAAAKESFDSESESESETYSDSESNPPPTQASVKSLAVTTVPSAAKPKKKETEAAALSLPEAKSGAKRPREGTSRETKSKRGKKATSGDEEKKIGEDAKKPAFQRMWTEDDEITILQGMIDFQADNGQSPYEDTTDYYNLTKGSISVEVSKSQFMDKLRGLRKKYVNKDNPCFTKPHDQKCYKLCKYIWGSDGLALESAVKSKTKKSKKSGQKKTKMLDAVKPNGKEKAVEDDDSVAVKKSDWFEKSFLVGAIASIGVDESYVKEKWSLVPVETKKKVADKVKVFQGKEFEFVVLKHEFLHEVTSMLLESTKNMPLDI